MSKVRIYDLAKELKVDSKKVMEDVRRFGVDVRVASNTVSDEIAEKVRSLYFPKRTVSGPPPSVKLMKSPPPPGGGDLSSDAKPAVVAPRLMKAPKPAETVHMPSVAPAAVDAPPAQAAVPASFQVVPLTPPPAPDTTPAYSSSSSAATSESSGVQVRPLVPVPPPPPPPPGQPSQPTVRPINVPPPPPRPNGAQGVFVRSFTAPAPVRRVEPPARPPAPSPAVRRDGPSAPARSLERSPSAETPSPDAASQQGRTYIPPRDQQKAKGRRGKGGRVVGSGAARGKQEQERNLGFRSKSPVAPPAPRPVFTEFKPIKVMEGTTVKELAEKLEVKPKDMVALLFGKGLMVTINQTISEEMMREIGREFGFDVTIAPFEEMVSEEQDLIAIEADSFEDLDVRAPVVAVMGHVDHGKTSLLDAIRNTRVAAGEAGGITQHIGAYSVEVPNPDDRLVMRRIVFLDTPGHEAFTLMRARGAKGADVAVIVVAADDGVMPQTIEAIDHARAANVPLVVAINKIDKPQANVERVKKELGNHGLVWDGWGGDTVMVEISAKQRINLDGLLEMILLTSDILELKSPTKRIASGVVLEARLDKGRGPVASVLVQQGTLKVGDPIIAGLNFGRVRALFDDRGRGVQSAGPSVPVEVLGFQGVPKAGDLFQVVNDAAKAQEIATWRQSKFRMTQLMSTAARGLEDVFEQMKSGQLKELLVILKADVQGSVEVLRDTLEKLSTERVMVRVIRSDVGAITESDVLLASASNDMAHTCIIIGFNVRPAPRVAELAKQEKVDIRLHSIIYKVEEEMRKAMIGLLDPTTKDVSLGRAEVRQVIKIPKIGHIAGCLVLDGVIKRTGQVRVLRDSVVVFEGQITSLRRFKEDASEVKSGFECGIGIDRFPDVKIGDVLECFSTEKVTPTEL
jgi:translation initiation factor IF-2